MRSCFQDQAAYLLPTTFIRPRPTSPRHQSSQERQLMLRRELVEWKAHEEDLGLPGAAEVDCLHFSPMSSLQKVVATSSPRPKNHTIIFHETRNSRHPPSRKPPHFPSLGPFSQESPVLPRTLREMQTATFSKHTPPRACKTLPP